MVNAKKSSGVSVQALRSMWDQSKPAKTPNVQQHQTEPPPAPLPSLPPKSRNRKLTGTVSVDATSLSPSLPPVPKRGIRLGLSLTGSLPETTPHPDEAQIDQNRVQRHRGGTNSSFAPNRDSFHPTDSNNSGDFYKEIVSLADLHQVENRSQSLPHLGNHNVEGKEEEEEEEEKYSNRFNSLSVAAPTQPKRTTCQTYSLHVPPQGLMQRSSGSEPENGSQDQLRSNPLYQSSEAAAGSQTQVGENMYAEVPQGRTETTDDTYEQIPGDGAAQGDTYESVEDVKNKKPKSTFGKNNINWKKFFPDYKKK